jgi:hypothetical protein
MRVDAGPVARAYEVVDGRLRRAVERVERELALVVDGVTVTDADLVPDGEPRVDAGEAGLSWRLSHPVRDLQVSVRVAADREAGVVRKHVEVSGRGRLEAVELDRWPGTGAGAGARARGPRHTEPTRRGNAGAPGLGQPVFTAGSFVGVEHPGAANLVDEDGTATCVLPCAVDLGPEPFVTPPAVVGAAPAGRELGAVWDYLDHVRARAPRMVVLANNWYQLGWPGLMNRRSVSAELAGFAAVGAEHGLQLDAYCLDDNWEGGWRKDTGVWGRFDPSRFRGGLPALQAAAGPVGIGLWVSPFGGYYTRGATRVAWGTKLRFEVDPGVDAAGRPNGWGERLCPAGPTYGAHLASALRRWTAEGVRYWKLDGVQFDCQGGGHGHATGPGGRTDQMDRFAALLDHIGAAAAAGPGVAIAFTSGSNPSPWWLRHADFLWRGGLDDTAVELAGPRLVRFDTYIDDCLNDYRETALPVSALVTFSVVENGAVSYREAGRSAQDWERHCWWMVGRGTLHHDLYCAPDSLSGPEWAAVARALRWARERQPVLARSRMVGGHPLAGEVYGFVSRRGHQSVVALRNPAGAAQTFRLTLAELAGPEAGGSPVAIHTPWSDAGPLPDLLDPQKALTVRLPPYGVVVLAAG